jgi:hypothetical protein
MQGCHTIFSRPGNARADHGHHHSLHHPLRLRWHLIDLQLNGKFSQLSL